MALGAVAESVPGTSPRLSGSDHPRPTRGAARALRPLQQIAGTPPWPVPRDCRTAPIRSDGLANRNSGGTSVVVRLSNHDYLKRKYGYQSLTLFLCPILPPANG